MVEAKDTFLCATYLIILFTIFVQVNHEFCSHLIVAQGTTLKPFVHLFKVKELQRHEGDPYKLFIEFNYGVILWDS